MKDMIKNFLFLLQIFFVILILYLFYTYLTIIFGLSLGSYIFISVDLFFVILLFYL